jgi:curved DNA-binding protein CbpA
MENRVLIEVTNNSEHTFVHDGEWLRAGEWKSNEKAVIEPKSLSMVELQSSQFRGVQGIMWWTDAATHEVYLSMAVANPRLQAACFACSAGLPPGNLKSELLEAPRLAQKEVRTGPGCKWVGAAVGSLTVVRLTIHEDLLRYSAADTAQERRNVTETADITSGGASSSTAPAPSAERPTQPPDLSECTDLASANEAGDDMATAKEQVEKFMAQTRPKDAVDGVTKGFKTAGTSILAGVGTVVASTVQGTQQGGVLGFVKGAGCGLVGGVAITVGGTVCGVAQIGRGIANTPDSFRNRREHRVWDVELGQWVDIDLAALERQVEDENSDEEEGNSGSCEVAETEYYDLLKIKPNATQNDIKKAYHKEARQCHPDKNPGDSEAKVKFQKLAAAYQVLSDPETRKTYNRDGKAGIEEGAGMNLEPTVFFSLLFGSERFDPYMGELNLAMQTDQFTKTLHKEGQSEKSTEEVVLEGEKAVQVLKRRQFRREVRCACHLRNKLDRYVLGRDPSGWEEQMRLEAVDLVNGQFGPELLMTLGEMYRLRADIYLADELVGRYSLTKRVNSARHSMLTFGHRMSFWKNAASSLVSVKRIHDAASKMKEEEGQEEESEAREEEEASRKVVEEALDTALPTFLQTAWASVVTDIDNTIKEVGRKLLKDKSVPWQIRIRRAQALLRLGEIFYEEGAKASATQGTTLMSSEAAKSTLQEALVESLREKKRGSATRSREETSTAEASSEQA